MDRPSHIRGLAALGQQYPQLVTIVRYGLSTITSSSLSFLLPIALHSLAGIAERPSVAISFVIAYVLNFAILRRAVFSSSRKWHRDLARYAVVNAIFRVAEFLAFSALFATNFLPYAGSLFTVLVLSTIIKYFAFRRIFSSAV